MSKFYVRCPGCRTKFALEETLRGKRARCKQCQTFFRLPAAPPSAGATTPQTAAAAWEVGQTILDLYEVKGLLGEGGMGQVYRVHHRGWGLDLAVKVPRPQLLSRKGAVEDFEREAETWVNLGLHPHTASCYYVRRLESLPCVFAELVEGGDLAGRIRSGEFYQGGPQAALTRILDVAIQFAWGLHHAHQQGLVHQDVKPANVLMTVGGTAKVTDFGLAGARALAGENTQAAGGQSILVSTGGMTPAYCSPEQANRLPLSRKTDVWSWAVSVLEMFTGEVTWPSGTVAGEAFEGHLGESGGDGRLPEMPPGLVELLRHCFRPDPGARPADMLEIAGRLREVFARATGESYRRPDPQAVDLLADGLNNRAVSLLDLGKPELALQLWDEALKADALHPEATCNAGLVRWRRAEWDDALVLQKMRAVGQARPGHASPVQMLAGIHLERGDCAAALEALGQVGDKGTGRDVPLLRRLAEQMQPDSRRRLRTFEGHQGAVKAVCFGGDGRLALSGSGDRTLKLWEVSTGRCLRTFEGHTRDVSSVCLSKDGRFALSGSWDQTVKLWEVSTGRCLRTFEGHKGAVNAVCFGGDGRLALSGSGDKSLKLWEVPAGRCLRTFEGHTHDVLSACLSEDGRVALSGSKFETPRLWEVSTGRCLRTFEGAADDVLSVCSSGDGRFALSANWWDQTVKLWEVSTGRCLRSFAGHTKGISSACLTGDGRFALSVSEDMTLKLWEVSTGRCLCTQEVQVGGNLDFALSVALSGDGRLALAANGSHTLTLWANALDWNRPAPLRLSQVVAVDTAASARDAFEKEMAQGAGALEAGRWNAAAESFRRARTEAGYEFHPRALQLWSELYLHLPRVRFRASQPTRTFEGHRGYVKSVCFSDDGQCALSGSNDGTLKLWEVATGRCLRTLEGHTGVITSVCLSADGRFALSANGDEWPTRSADKTLKLWEASTGRCLRTFEGHTDDVTSACLSADGRSALSGSKDMTLKLWEASTGRCLRTFEGHTGWVESVCLSGDDRFALSGGEDMTLKLWEVSTGRSLRTLEGHKGWHVKSICFSSDGRFALSGSNDRTLKLWEVSTGRCLRTFEGHTDWVLSACLSMDGRFALSGSDDRTLKLWEVSTGRCLHTFEGHTNDVTSVSLSRDGRFALSGSEDAKLKLWFLDWDLDVREPVDWDEGARPYLAGFLTWCGRPTWTHADWQHLLFTLGCAGYGWLRPEGVGRELEKMAAAWQGPPPST